MLDSHTQWGTTCSRGITHKQNKTLLEQAHNENWRLILYHEPETPVVTVAKNDKDRFVLEITNDCS